MELPLTHAALPLVRWIPETGSTNALLREMVADDPTLPHGTLVVTANQTAGRGRAGRGWETPADTATAASLLVRPSAYSAEPAGRAGVLRSAGLESGAQPLGLSWLPLLAGSAIAAALQPLFRGDAGGGTGGFGEDAGFGAGLGGEDAPQAKRVGVKWPNDVHVRDEDDAMAGRPGAKLCGILCEVLPNGDVVVGFGINFLQEEWQLPTERAGSVLASGGRTNGAMSLASERGEALADGVLAAATTELLRLVELAHEHPETARRRVLRDSLTLGAEVRVHLPGGEIVDGRAVGLDEHGALIVDRPTTGQLIVNAADVEHLR